MKFLRKRPAAIGISAIITMLSVLYMVFWLEETETIPTPAPPPVIQEETPVPTLAPIDEDDGYIFDLAERTGDVASTEAEPLVLLESGYSIVNGFLGSYDVYLAFTVKNTSDTVGVLHYRVRFTARSASGAIIGTDEMWGGELHPGHTLGNTWVTWLDEKPETIEFELLPPREHELVPVSRMRSPEHVQLTVENISVFEDGTGDRVRITGEVINNTGSDLDFGQVHVIFRDTEGQIIGGDMRFLSDIRAGRSMPFEIPFIPREIVTDNFEVFATFG